MARKASIQPAAERYALPTTVNKNGSSSQEDGLLVLSPDFPPVKGGIQTVAYQLSRQLGKIRPTRVLAPSSQSFDDEPFSFHELPDRPPGIAQYLTILTRLFRVQPRWVIVAHWHYTPPALMYGKLTGADVVTIGHATEISTVTPESLLHRLMRYSFQQSQGVIVPSEHSEGLVRELGVEEKRIHRVPWGVDLDYFRPVAPEKFGHYVSDGAPVLLTVSSLNRDRKNIELVLDIIADGLDDVTYFVVGDGEKRSKLEAKAERLGIQDKVIFTGFVDDHDLRELYSLADIFVMPGRLDHYEEGDAEAFGLVFLEAAACGTPSVAFDIGGVRSAIEAGTSGVLVNPASPDAFPEILARISANPELLDELSASARRWAEQHSWQRAAESVLEALDDSSPRNSL